MFEFLLAALLFALGASVARLSMKTPGTRQAFWESFTRNMGYGLLNTSLVYLSFQELLNVRNVQGVIATAVAAALMWLYSVRKELSTTLFFLDLGRIGRLVMTYSLIGYVAQLSLGRLYAAALGFCLWMACILVMNRLTLAAARREISDNDGGMGN
jgi:hypothetical protein